MITKILDAGTEDMRARFVFYLHRQKHAQLCDFLYSLPPGTVSNFVREAVQQYTQLGGLSSASADQKQGPSHSERNTLLRNHTPSRLPATTQIPISARAADEDEPLPQPDLSLVTVTNQLEPNADRRKNSSKEKGKTKGRKA